ncbi:MAG: hypothetical protein HYY93_15270 [Planctomycetes bacterium]|nr:hypothetical protein [Planctomycetota bacterium]
MKALLLVSRTAAIALLVLAASGCAALLRVPVPRRTGFLLDRTIVDRGLCSSETKKRLRVEIDYVTGWAPGEKALAALRETLERYCDKPGGVEVEVDEEIRLEGAWTGSRDQIAALTAAHRPPVGDASIAFAYVLYCPSDAARPELRGYCHHSTEFWPGTDFEFITIYTREVRRLAFLWVTSRRIERTVLVHEFGHAMGLVRNPDHAYPEDVHCNNPGCVMYKRVDARAILANFLPALLLARVPYSFCDACDRDLALGRLPRDEYPSRLIREFGILPDLSEAEARALDAEARDALERAAREDPDPEVRRRADAIGNQTRRR